MLKSQLRLPWCAHNIQLLSFAYPSSNHPNTSQLLHIQQGSASQRLRLQYLLTLCRWPWLQLWAKWTRTYFPTIACARVSCMFQPAGQRSKWHRCQRVKGYQRQPTTCSKFLHSLWDDERSTIPAFLAPFRAFAKREICSVQVHACLRHCSLNIICLRNLTFKNYEFIFQSWDLLITQGTCRDQSSNNAMMDDQ